jgi:Interleukin-like EMT inducer
VAGSVGPGASLSVEPARARLAWRLALLAYPSYVAGVAVATWPLARRLSSAWPDHHDPALFTWVMASWVDRLLQAPSAVFDGNAFYPHSKSLAYGEILLVPALLGFPGFIAGQPVLTYNLLVLLLWPVNGVAMAWVAYELTGSRGAAWLAGAIFSLSPYFTEYYLEFNMLPAAAVPVAMLAWVRWLERQDPRWLAVALAALVVQGLTSWYYTIILGLGLVTLTLGFCALRWREWRVRRDLVALAFGGAAVLAILAALAWPYWVVHREFGYERGLPETSMHYADLLSFIEPGARSRFFPWDWTGHVPETSPFVGFTGLLLGLLGVGWARRAPLAEGGPRWLGRVGAAGLVGALAAFGVVGFLRHHTYHVGALVLRLRAAPVLNLALAAGLLLLAAHGWAHWRRRAARDLDPGDWARLLTLLVGVSVVLALGPVVHVGRRAVGIGPYVGLYHVLLPLHVIRITARFGILTVAGLALLAALGWQRIAEGLRGRPAVRRSLAVACVGSLLLEYAVRPADLVPVDPRGVDAVLRADLDDVAVLEWPSDAAGIDTEAMFRSLSHGKRVVNGHSGFTPPALHDLSTYLGEPGPPFPTPAAQDALRRIYGLRYVVARLGTQEFQEVWRPSWVALRQNTSPLLRFRGTYGTDDLYEVLPLPERRRHVERLVSRDMLVRHPALRLSVAPLLAPGVVEQAIEIRLNGHLVRSLPLTGRVDAEIPLDGPLMHAVPNVIALDYVYSTPPGWLDPDLYRIGRTDVRAPVDLYVASAGQPYTSSRSVIQLNGRDVTAIRRGYNLVTLDGAGAVRATAAFDTFDDPRASHELADWVRAIPAGTVVIGVVSDEASSGLGGDAVAALWTLGVEGDLRGHFRESHAFVGVKGAARGAALEDTGPRVVELRVGSPDFPAGFELAAFSLTASPRR